MSWKTRDFNKRREILWILMPFLFVLAITLLLYGIKQMAPFGTASLVWEDAFFQYTYYLCYLKDVFAGKGNILYSFSNGLGKTNIGLLAYYLMSPVNLALSFVEKDQLSAFIDIIIAVKFAACAGTMSFFLLRRFEGRIPKVMHFLLSVSYAWNEYTWSQCSNFMWLEGVCLLPLIMLEVYKLLRQNREIELSVLVALSVVMQWYTAGINCLFAFFYFMFELGILLCEQDECTSLKSRHDIMLFCLRKTRDFCFTMMAGTLLSAILFWPVILDLRSGKGTFDWNILNLWFRGNILSTFKHNVIGGYSTIFIASLFCGSVVVLGMIGLILNQHLNKRIRLLFAAMLLFTTALYYWQPLYVLFSLLKSADSYFYRYSYVSIAFLVMGAGYYFALPDAEKNATKLLGAGMTWAVLLCAVHFLDDHSVPTHVWCTALMMALTSFCLWMAIWKTSADAAAWSMSARLAGTVLLAVVSITELLWNGNELTKYYSWGNADFNDAYNVALDRQIRAIQEQDSGFYRISQTSSKELQHERENISASYTNALGYGYAGIASYSSCPDLGSLDFLDRAGYRNEADCASVVNTSILPVDSLLGVKYILSPYDITGYKKMGSADSLTRLALYQNNYALPMAFTMDPPEAIQQNEENQNPFEYVNALYTSLNGGEEVRVFVPAEYEMRIEDGIVTCIVTGLNERDLLYGDFAVDSEEGVLIDVNGVYSQGYNCWLAPSVFLIPVKDNQAVLTLQGENVLLLHSPQLYTVDFDALEKVVSVFRGRAVSCDYDGGRSIKLQTVAREGEQLFLSVPFNSGWKAILNGQEVPLQKAADNFIRLPLSEGYNEVLLEYHVPGMGTGIALSAFGLIMLWILWQKQKKPCQ